MSIFISQKRDIAFFSFGRERNVKFLFFQRPTTVGIKMDAKFLPTVAGTGLFKWARKSRIFLTEKLLVLFSSAMWPFVPGPNSLRIFP